MESCFLDVPKKILSESDVIIHLAAITNATKSFGNTEVEEVNINKTKEFIDRCSIESDCRFIFPSSTSVYGVASDLVTEDDDSFLNPQSPYAESKIEIERYLRESDIDYIVVRLGTIFGCSPGMRFHTAVNKFCYQASLGQPLTVWKQNYHQYRPYLGIRDCIEALRFIMKNSDSSETYNVVSDNYKLSEVIEFIRSIRSVKLNKIETPLINQYSYKVCTKKLQRLGFYPKDDISRGIFSTMRTLQCLEGC